jgi:hypothetical protein
VEERPGGERSKRRLAAKGRIGALYSCGGVAGKLNWSRDRCPKLGDAVEKDPTSRRDREEEREEEEGSIQKKNQ